MYIHTSHVLTSCIDTRSNSTLFSTFSPLRDLEKAIVLETKKMLLFLDSFLHTPLFPRKVYM